MERIPGRASPLRASLMVAMALWACGLLHCDDYDVDEDEGCSAGCNVQIPKKAVVPPLGGPRPIDSGQLRRTAVLPTLDTPLPEGKNAVWHVGTPLVWKQSRKELPVAFPSPVGDPIAARLERSAASERDVDPRSLLLAFGKADRETLDRIRLQVTKRFPGHDATLLEKPDPLSYLSYAFLSLSVPFSRPYMDQPRGMYFCEADGKRTFVRAFGLGDEEMGAYDKEREQVRVLFGDGRFRVLRGRVKKPEFAVDLDRSSSPYQIVLAAIERPASLAQGFERVLAMESRHWESWIREHGDPPSGELEQQATLLVPNQDWDLLHRHRELEKDPTILFRSRIRFRLDRFGAALVTEDAEHALGTAPRYDFNRPFLLYIRRRGAPRPCLALWIENPELLDPVQSRKDDRLDGALLPPEADAVRKVDVPMFNPSLELPTELASHYNPVHLSREDRERLNRFRRAFLSGRPDVVSLRRVVRSHLEAIQVCYTAGLPNHPAMRGTVQVEFHIDTDGRVETVRSVSTLLDEQVTQCIEWEVRGWQFPRANKKAVFTYPFRFHCACDYQDLYDSIVLRWIESGRNGPPPLVPPHGTPFVFE